VKPGDLVRISESIEPVRRKYWGYYTDTAGLYLEEYIPMPGRKRTPDEVPWASVDFGAKGAAFIPLPDLEVLSEAR